MRKHLVYVVSFSAICETIVTVGLSGSCIFLSPMRSSIVVNAWDTACAYTEETRAKQSIAANPGKPRKPRSEDTKAKLRAASIAYWKRRRESGE